jgi:hypothetical protein
MRQLRLIPFLAAALILLTACGGQAASAPMPAAMATQAPASEAAAERDAGAAASLEGAPAGGVDNSAPQQPASQRLVIKNATVSLQVDDVAAAEAQLRARAEQLGGYVVSVQTSGSDQYMASTVTFRVPAARFEDALAGVEGLARKVLSRSVSGDDVTEEFVDLESRLRNLEATRDRLLDLLGKATRVEDALQVNQALTDVQGQIEQIQGRMKYLRDSAAFSTITADLQPVPAPPALIEPDGWQPLRVAQQALAGLISFGQGLASLAIVLLVWSPVWLPLLLLALWAMRRIGTRSKPA